MTEPSIHETAATLARHGLSIVPLRNDGSKSPSIPWAQYQKQRPTDADIDGWFAAGHAQGLGAITGAISGNLVMFEIEGRGIQRLPEIGELAKASGLEPLLQRLSMGWLEESPSGGYHWLAFLDHQPPRNTKLARRPATPAELEANPGERIKVLAETRGEGGFTVLAPSEGQCHPTGRPWRRLIGGPATAARLTRDEYQQVCTLLSTLDEMPPPQEPAQAAASAAVAPVGGARPGDDYEARTEWADILTGWTFLYRQGNTSFWRRPGKTEGISASTGHADDRDRLYVFSTSTEFEAERPYTKFSAYAVLNHGGDHSAAAKQLRADGYGAEPADDLLDLTGIPTRTAATLTPTAVPPPAPRTTPISLEQAHAVFRSWLGAEYDTEALDAVLAAAACNQLDGDPLWLLLLSGSGNAKTETVQALQGAGASIISTISSAGALLSATSTKEKTKDATGGLLRKIGSQGVLVVKDVTSILSMDRNARAEVLAALREVYDGHWSRNVGTDGGRTLDWAGRLVVIGAVTTAWDRAHDVIASMGDRFVTIRMDSTTHRQTAGRKAIGNTGHEEQMRAELEAAAQGVLAGLNTAAIPATLTEPETQALIEAANIVTLARTGVEYDYRGDVIDAHAPEMPTRFAKQLTQVVRGGIALGMDRTRALNLAIRCARDSMPPMRLAILDDVAAHPQSPTKDVRRRINKPRSTVDRQLQALHMLGVLEVEEEGVVHGSVERTVWRYTVANDIDPDAIQLKSVPDLLVPPHKDTRKRSEQDNTPVRPPTNKSGTQTSAQTTNTRGSRSSTAGQPVTPNAAHEPLDLDHILGPVCSVCGFRDGHSINCLEAQAS